MKSIIKAALVSAFLFVPVLAVLSVSAVSKIHAQEEQTEEQATEESVSNTYNYTAQAGDSYSLIGRKAVQTYGIIHSVNLSEAQIIAAETFLTLEAGSPVLNVSEAISIQESSVKSAIEKAQGLSDKAKSLWQKYADKADFNTDNVGEVRE